MDLLSEWIYAHDKLTIPFPIFPFSHSSLLWDSDSFPASSLIGPRPCPDPRNPALLISPGDQIISHSLLGGTRGVVFDAEFSSMPSFCMGAEYSPVEVRQCRSIEGVLGECQLVRLVSRSGDYHSIM